MNMQGILTSGEQNEVEVTQESTEATQGIGDETKDLSDQVSCLWNDFGRLCSTAKAFLLNYSILQLSKTILCELKYLFH